MSRERRIHARTKTRLEARLAREGATVAGVVENLGEGGAFFATDDLETPIPDGAEVVVTFAVPRGGAPAELRLEGTVLRSERYFDGRAVVRALAIRFASPLDLAGLALG
jgi:hypothetical protein